MPEELFGPLSIKGLEEDRYQRLTETYLPTASIAFLDEIFKANSAILNALLTLLNEREFDNGTQRVRTPLVAVIGASNELPEGDELEALYDRFLLRIHIGPVSNESFPNLLGLRGNCAVEVPSFLRLTEADLGAVQEASEQVEVPADVVAMLCDLRDWCLAENIRVSDRRWRKVVKLLQVSALTNGRQNVSVWDCWLLQHCLWEKPEDQIKVYDWYASRVGASSAMDPSRLTRIVTTWEGTLKADQDSRSQKRDPKGCLLFKDQKGRPTENSKGAVRSMRGGEPLYLAPINSSSSRDGSAMDRTRNGQGYTEEELGPLNVKDPHGYGRDTFRYWDGRGAYLADKNNWLMNEVDLPPLMEPTKHKGVYIEQCLKEIEKLQVEVEIYQSKLSDHIASLKKEIDFHLWVSPSFAKPASVSLKQTEQEVLSLLGRIKALGESFKLLPRENDGDASIGETGLAIEIDLPIVEKKPTATTRVGSR